MTNQPLRATDLSAVNHDRLQDAAAYQPTLGAPVGEW
jgi:hypothetical protein